MRESGSGMREKGARGSGATKLTVGVMDEKLEGWEEEGDWSRMMPGGFERSGAERSGVESWGVERWGVEGQRSLYPSPAAHNDSGNTS